MTCSAPLRVSWLVVNPGFMGAVLTVLCACAWLSPASARTVLLSSDGVARVRIVVPDEPSERVQHAATELADFLKRSTGADFEVVEETAAKEAGLANIHVGLTTVVRGLDLGLDALDADGFVLSFPEDGGAAVVICGASDYGTQFGVYEFLERYVGVRWLFPGELGEHVPSHATLDVQAAEVRDAPSFFSRQMSGLRGREQVIWAQRNRMHGRIKFHHNLIRLFPPETYTKTHPEFFPIQNGTRFLPETNTPHHWQPCYTAPGLVEEAVKNIDAFFDAHPDAPSYSLGANDSSGYCQCDACMAQIPGTDNFLGRVDYSDLYYDWANKVIEGVLKEHPDKYFGCLAYSEVAAPPEAVSVHPRMIPYMTYDRMKWLDEEIESEGHEMTRDWAAASPTLGWYDYIYGSSYCVPRVWFHKMGEYYRFGFANNVRCSYAEAYPSDDWREGPKLYVSLKLLWDPSRDVDELLDDWYRCAVGPEAAPALAAYYRFWEEFWAGPVLETEWFKSARKRQYLNFSATGYLDALSTDDLSRCRALLTEVLEKSQTEQQEARARKFLDDFNAFTELVTGEIETRMREQATRELTREAVERMVEVRTLTGPAAAHALDAYRTWLSEQQECPMTGALHLTAGLLAERGGHAGAWRESLAASPWGATSSAWLLQSLATIDPAVVLDKEELPVVRASEAPVIDGKLDEACWRDAEKIGDFVDYIQNRMVEQPTFVAAAYDSANLYLGYVCLQRDMQTLLASCRQHDGPVWRDDCVEFFVSPSAEPDTFYQLIVNTIGTTFDAGGRSRGKWNPDWQVKVVKGDLLWAVEMAVPFAALPGPVPEAGDVWRANFTRSRRRFGQQFIGVWRFADGKNNDIAEYGRLAFR